MKRTPIKSRGPEKRHPSANGRPASAYLALIDQFPLRPLRNARDYDTAAAILDKLAVRPEGSLERGEQDYFETLTILVEAYDTEQHIFDVQPRDALTTLKYLMEESGLTQAGLGRLLGNRALASLILHGHRSLSKTHIRKLAAHFKVSPALFLQAS